MRTLASRVGALAVAITIGGGSAVSAKDSARTMAELEARMQAGTEVDVVDRQGRILRGGFASAGDDGILITVYGSAEGRRIPAADVVNVTRAGDSLKNGALIGAAAGALTALAVMTDDTGASGCFTTGCKAGFSAFAVAAYTGIGALIDRAVKGREDVYRAPAHRVSLSVTPHPVPRGAGVQLAVKF